MGRGTATFDGTAIAHAVIDHLIMNNRCRTLFATHYHSLINDWEIDPRIKLGHMTCIVQTNETDSNDNDNDAQLLHNYNQSMNNNDSNNEMNEPEVTFLYKLADGSSPRSYGINVAKLALLPNEVIELAIKKSMEFELKMNNEHNIQKKEFYERYYEKLISIINSKMTINEIYYYIEILWNSYHKELIK